MPSEVESPMWTTARQELRVDVGEPGSPGDAPDLGARARALTSRPPANELGDWIAPLSMRIPAVTEVTGPGGPTPASPTQARTRAAPCQPDIGRPSTDSCARRGARSKPSPRPPGRRGSGAPGA